MKDEEIAMVYFLYKYFKAIDVCLLWDVIFPVFWENNVIGFYKKGIMW
jgi:hypothetical protein